MDPERLARAVARQVSIIFAEKLTAPMTEAAGHALRGKVEDKELNTRKR